MSGCSGGCGGCGSSKQDDHCHESKDGCDDCKECGHENGSSCDCLAKLKIAMEKASKDNGMKCCLCNTFSQYAGPNRCNGAFICYKCKTTNGWKIPKGKWIK